MPEHTGAIDIYSPAKVTGNVPAILQPTDQRVRYCVTPQGVREIPPHETVAIHGSYDDPEEWHRLRGSVRETATTGGFMTVSYIPAPYEDAPGIQDILPDPDPDESDGGVGDEGPAYPLDTETPLQLLIQRQISDSGIPLNTRVTDQLVAIRRFPKRAVRSPDGYTDTPVHYFARRRHGR